MNSDTWKKILSEIAEWPNTVTLMTHGAGEPLLYPDLWKLLSSAGRMPNIRMGFMTNGMLLKERSVERILELQVRWLALSIDGTDVNTHDFYRVHAHLPSIEQHVDNLIQRKYRQGIDYPQLHFNMVGYPEILDQSLDYVRKWLPHATLVTIAKFRPVGSRKLWPQAPVTFRPCPLLHRQMVIGFDGQVGLCCEDIHLDVPLGNVGNNSLLDIYNHSPLLQHYRSQHDKGEIDTLSLCRDCHVWGGDLTLSQTQYKLDGMSILETTTPAFRKFEKISENHAKPRNAHHG